MRLRIGTWGLVAGLLALAAGAGAGDERWGSDREWCADGNDGWGRARYCEVRDVPLTSGGAFHVDARPNGGVSVRGVDRAQPKLQARVMATAETEADARALASEVRIETAGTIHAVGPQRSHDRSWWISYRLE